VTIQDAITFFASYCSMTAVWEPVSSLSTGRRQKPSLCPPKQQPSVKTSELLAPLVEARPELWVFGSHIWLVPITPAGESGAGFLLSGKH